MDVNGRVAVITGGAQGFGRRLAERLVGKGAKVVVGDIDDTKGKETVEQLNAAHGAKVSIYRTCDVTDSKQLEALINSAVTEFGHLDVLVNNAGVIGTQLWHDADDSKLGRAVNVNVKAVIDGTRIAVRHWLGLPSEQQPGSKRETTIGVVVNLASAMAFLPMEFDPVYGATKAAIVNFTASCATLAPRVRVNAVAPSYADTGFIKPLQSDCQAAKNLAVFSRYGLHTIDQVVDQIIRCIEDKSLAGDTIRMMPGLKPIVHTGRKAINIGLGAAKL